MLRRQLTSPKLKSLSDSECSRLLALAWVKVKMLTGVLLYPKGEGFEQQMDVLHTFLKASPRFMALTLEELEYAFLLNVQGAYGEIIPHYNRELDANYLGQILSAYCEKYRRLCRDKEEVVRYLSGTEAPHKAKSREVDNRPSKSQLFFGKYYLKYCPFIKKQYLVLYYASKARVEELKAEVSKGIAQVAKSLLEKEKEQEAKAAARTQVNKAKAEAQMRDWCKAQGIDYEIYRKQLKAEKQQSIETFLSLAAIARRILSGAKLNEDESLFYEQNKEAVDVEVNRLREQKTG